MYQQILNFLQPLDDYSPYYLLYISFHASCENMVVHQDIFFLLIRHLLLKLCFDNKGSDLTNDINLQLVEINISDLIFSRLEGRLHGLCSHHQIIFPQVL